jgi:hypothetical protein
VSVEEGCAREVLFVSIFQRYFKTNAKMYNATTSSNNNNDNNNEHNLFVCVRARAAFYGGVNAAAGWLKFNF